MKKQLLILAVLGTVSYGAYRVIGSSTSEAPVVQDGEDRVRQVVVYEVPGSSTKCLLWPTGRGNLRRDGFVPR